MTPNDTFASPRATVFAHETPQIRVQNRSLAPTDIGKHPGQGFVVVQTSEEVPGSFVSGTGGGQQAGAAGSAAAGILGNFLGR